MSDDFTPWLLAQVGDGVQPDPTSEAVRAVVLLHSPTSDVGTDSPTWPEPPACGTCVAFHADWDCANEVHPCQTLRLLAAPYAERPGYQEGWRP